MALPILSTKLHIPQAPANWVSRPRLTERLQAAIEQPGAFALLSGPAGFGKTTLLSEFAEKLRRPVAWVSLEETDNDPARFWTYIITACQSVQREIGESALAVLQAAQPLPDESIPTILINDLVRLKAELVLILDDYHVIQSQNIHSAISFLLDHLPEELHLLVSTRMDPPWPLARLRARGRLVEIRARDLRFTTEETSAFLNSYMGLGLSHDDVAALEERTEGWIASLQLAALSMKGRGDVTHFIKAFTGSHVFVAEYLLEEVLNRQSAERKSFLFQTSILDRLHAGLCDAVSGRTDSHVLLKDLYQANLFLLALDDQGEWFRYHRLFADLLRARLLQTASAEEIAGLHRRAAAWHDQNGYVGEAIQHALAGRDYEEAARLVEKHGQQFVTRGELTTLLGWIEALPPGVLQQHPQILISKAWLLTLAGAIGQVEPLLRQVESAIISDDEDSSTRDLLGNAAAIRAFFAMMRGDYPQALELAERADSLLPESRVHARWLVPYTIGAVHRAAGRYAKAVEAFARQAHMGEANDNLIVWATGMTEVAIVLRLQGKLRACRDTSLHSLQKLAARGADRFGSLAKLEIPLIEVLREQNQLEEAHRRLQDVIARLQPWPMPTDRIFAYLAQIQLQEARGDLAGAWEGLRAAKELKTNHPVLLNLARSVDLLEIQLTLKSGDLTTAEHILEELRPGASPIVSLRDQELMMLARLQLAQGKLQESDRILSHLEEETEAGGRMGALIQVLALHSCVLDAKGNRDTALKVLTKTLTLGEPQGFVRVFLEEGKVMRQLLSAAAHRFEGEPGSIRLKPYVARLLEAFPPGDTLDTAHISPGKETGLVEPLTSRELEVLQLIAAGLSNQIIADKLVITLSAVKKHAGNIFGKLNVNSRTQAVARARQIGLLSPDE